MALYDVFLKKFGTLGMKIKAVENLIEELETETQYYRKLLITNEKKIEELQSELEHLKFKQRK